MTLGTRVAALAAVLLAASCRATRPPRAAGDGCPAAFPVIAAAFGADTAAAVAALVGDFTIVSVRTTPGLPIARSRGRLTLRWSPPAERRHRPALAPATEREQPLTGAFRADGDSARGRPATVWRLRRDALVADYGSACFDCGGSTYLVERVGPEGFGGTWTVRFAGVSLVGPGGRTYDGVGGQFCARRVSAVGLRTDDAPRGAAVDRAWRLRLRPGHRGSPGSASFRALSSGLGG